MKKVALNIFAAFSSLMLIGNTLTTVSAKATTDDSEPYSAIGEQMLHELYEEWGYDAETIERISRSNFPAELYIYVDASILPIPYPNTDTLTVEVTYNHNNFDYFTHSDESVVSSCSSSDVPINSTYSKFTGTYTLERPYVELYTGNITAIRFRAATIGNDLYSYTFPTVNFTAFDVAMQSYLPIVNSYVSVQKRVPGDVNCNGYINEYDLELLARYVGGDSTVVIPSNGMLSIDINRDGTIDTLDTQMLSQFLNGSIYHF
jgi:hypothetical protein